MHKATLPHSYVTTVVLAIVVGTFVAGLSIAFLLLIQASEGLLYYNSSHTQLIAQFTQWNWWLFLALPFGGLVAGLLSYYVMPERKNIGLAGVVEAVHLRSGIIRFREGIGVGLVSAVSIGAGASVGRYGPAVHLGAAAGSWLAQLCNLTRENRVILLGCGAAAAIAASFNTPFAAVVFAHELVIRNYSIRAFAPVAIASTVGVILGRYFNPENMFNDIFFAPVTSLTDYGVAVLIGIACAYVGILFLKSLLCSLALGAAVPLHPIAKPVLGGLLLALIAAALPHTLGLGGVVVNGTLLLEHAFWLLCALLVAKAMAIIISFSLGFNGGLFGPALFLGTLTGAIVIVLLEMMGIEVSASSTLILIGGGCLISVVFGVPIATTIIIFELAGSYSVASAMLIGVVVTRLIANQTFGKSYLDHLIGTKGINIATSREDELSTESSVKDHMSDHPVMLKVGSTLGAAKEAVVRCGNTQELFVVDGVGKLIGIVRAYELIQTQARTLADVTREPSLVFTDTTSLKEAMAKIVDFTGLSVPVVNDEKVLVGMLSESALINAYQQISKQIQQEQHA